MSNNKKHVKTGWGQIDPNKMKKRCGWNQSKSTDEVKNEGFRGDLIPDWNFPKATLLE